MNWEVLATCAEIIGASGVIVSLIYVGYQVRLNTNQLKGEAIISINSAEAPLDEIIRDNPDLLGAILRGLDDWESIRAQDQARVHLYLYTHMRWFETCWKLWQHGTLDDGPYEARVIFVASLMGQPQGGRIWWEQIRYMFDQEFVRHLESKLEDLGETVPSITEVPFYKPENWPLKAPSREFSRRSGADSERRLSR